MKIITENQIIENRQIGGGAFSEVRRLKLNTIISICPFSLTEIVIKKPQKGSHELKNTIEKYEFLKSKNIKTLKFMEIIKVIADNVLLVEDLNNSNEMKSLSDKISGKKIENETEKEFFNSHAEIFRGENLLVEIIDFEIDLEKFIEEIKSISNIDLYTDCFFFSSSKINKSTQVNYVVADLDNINLNFSFDETWLKNNNLSEFLRSYSEFICKYFEVSEKKDYYIDYLNKKINQL